ncbi:hypothetical protein GDO86_010991 [Hymenochirus boettgeri]|uniref:UBX domain-containing protein 2B n=1 Tax=Hymenochirus boettgeri TaxID=247094 RepID=A0A8T2JA07_9PIPI|nr:hypothetical protein GDO86_010991 [Hymenochirus boettgeri]
MEETETSVQGDDDEDNEREQEVISEEKDAPGEEEEGAGLIGEDEAGPGEEEEEAGLIVEAQEAPGEEEEGAGLIGEDETAPGEEEEEAELIVEDQEAPGEEEKEEGAGPQVSHRPSVLDLQLALARLCEDEYSEQTSDSDKSTSVLQINEEHHFESSYSGNTELDSPGKIVNELFKEAKEHGAVPVNDASKSSEDLYKARIFAGRGYKLGDSSKKLCEYVQGEEQFENGQEVHILLKLWNNGFSLDDGELRSYSDPVNTLFLESIKKGEIPVELQRLVHGTQIKLDMEDLQDQVYVKPRLKFKAFSGEGQKLGSLTPEIISTPSSPEEEHKRFLNTDVDLDKHIPTTKIQIRLVDGSRLIQRFNLNHRIMDVRQFIIQARSEFAHIDFALVTTFPNTELTDETQTLEEADILNTVIIQRLK